MSTDGLTDELSGLNGDRSDGPSEVLPAPKILALCDHTLGEPGRRSHLFAWLRVPNSPPGQWLPVDAYYPRHRLVVVCHETSEAEAQLYAELVPRHRLRLLALDPAELGADPVAAELALRQRIETLEPARPAAPPPAIGRPAGSWDGPISRVASSFSLAAASSAVPRRPSSPARAAAAQRAARLAAGRSSQAATRPPRAPSPAMRAPSRAPAPQRGSVSTRRPPPAHRPTPTTRRPAPMSRPPRGPSQNLAGSLVLALATVTALELLIGVAVLALPAGAWLLALGLALDAAARALGTIAARRAGAAEQGWRCALGGSPAVAAFVLFGRDGPVAAHPAPLAGILSLLAMLLLLLGAATRLLHI
jgi:hypothetical protein